jgi:hypothetical protein
MLCCVPKKTLEIIWGLGLEHETYLQFEHATIIKGSELFPKIGRERYSLDYRENYKEGVLSSLSGYLAHDDYYFVYQMMNSHCFDKVDLSFEHKTLYTKDTPSNPKFSGKTVLDVLEEECDDTLRFQDMCSKREKSIGFVFFDGDAIEVITKHYANVTIPALLGEFRQNKAEFLSVVNRTVCKDMPVHYPEYNVGWNMFKTSPNIVLFNNGTYHVHVTLPTPMKNGRIVDYDMFTARHTRAISLLQWFEPFYISILGSPDIFSCMSSPHLFARGSMRNAISRYIGIGTYHPSMGTRKILTYPLEEFRKLLTIDEDKWWRTRVARDMAYALPSNEIGLDFNLHKMYQSGFEMRIFDAFPDASLEHVLLSILVLTEHAQRICVEWCTNDEKWNEWVFASIVHGYEARMSREDVSYLYRVCGIKKKVPKKEYTQEEVFFKLINILYKKYKKSLRYVFPIPPSTIFFESTNRQHHTHHKRQLTPLSRVFKL